MIIWAFATWAAKSLGIVAASLVVVVVVVVVLLMVVLVSAAAVVLHERFAVAEFAVVTTMPEEKDAGETFPAVAVVPSSCVAIGMVVVERIGTKRAAEPAQTIAAPTLEAVERAAVIAVYESVEWAASVFRAAIAVAVVHGEHCCCDAADHVGDV